MSYADVRRELFRQAQEDRRKARTQLPPRRPPPESVKEQLERIKAEIAKRLKESEE